MGRRRLPHQDPPAVTHRRRATTRPAPAQRVAGATALLAGLALACPAVQAAITLTADPALTSTSGLLVTHTRRLTMRVGIAQFGTISNVSFNVNGANVSPTPTPVTGVPSASAAPASSPANSVRVSVSNRWTTLAGQQVIVTVDSAAGLACTAGPCTGTTIPFSTISWTSFGMAGAPYAGQDFVSGSFTGSASQPLVNFTAPASQSFNITNDWVFTYNNATLYPAGTYTGRVTFTAVMP